MYNAANYACSEALISAMKSARLAVKDRASVSNLCVEDVVDVYERALLKEENKLFVYPFKTLLDLIDRINSAPSMSIPGRRYVDLGPLNEWLQETRNAITSYLTKVNR